MSLSLSAVFPLVTLLSSIFSPSSTSETLVSKVDIPVDAKVLGIGGFGEVYEINAQPKNVALKVPRMPSTLEELPTWLQALKREAKMLDILKSNLAAEDQQYFALVPPGFRNPVDAQCQDEILPGIVLPVYEKSLLDHILAYYSPILFTVDPEAVRLSIQIARSLRALHKLGIVHSDLKPANILLNLTGSEITVALTDFGGAVHQGEKITCSTKLYASSHDVERGISTTKMDIYSFGVVMYQLVTANNPPDWSQANTLESFQAKWRISLFSSLYKRCRSVDPTERPTADEIIEELTEIERAIPAHNRNSWIQFCLGWLLYIMYIVAVVWCCCRCCRRRRGACASKNAPPTSLKVMKL